MINLDVLIKYVRSGPKRNDWIYEVRRLKDRLDEMKLGFPGIRNDHLSLVSLDSLVVGDIFIVDPIFINASYFSDREWFIPKMYRVLGDGKFEILGIGCGKDNCDPDRTIYRYRDIVSYHDFPHVSQVFLVQCRPKLTGGSGYYYFYKSYRDLRD